MGLHEARRIAVGTFAVLALCVNEALSVNVAANANSNTNMQERFEFRAHLKSQADIEANLTEQKALQMVLGMAKMKSAPQVARLIQEKLGGHVTGAVAKAAVAKVNTSKAGKGLRGRQNPPTGYAAIKPAVDMLSDLYQEAMMNLDLSETKCGQFERTQWNMMLEAQRDVAGFNAEAASARACVLASQAEIGMLEEKIPQLEGELREHRNTCAREIGILEYQLRILEGDIRVVGRILNMTKCDQPTALVQNLLECPHCGSGGMIMLQHSGIQDMLNSLRSQAARGYLQQNLKSAFHEEALGPAVALTQEQVFHQIASVKGSLATVRRHREPVDFDTIIVNESDLNISEVPVPPERVDCVPTTKCTLKPSSCRRLREKFLLVEGGIVDKRDATSDELVELERYCEDTDKSLSLQLANLGNRLREVQAKLAECTQAQIDAESQSRQKGQQHAELKAEYTDTLTKCCDEQNTERSEMCALDKIRGEVTNFEGVSVFIEDCKVSAWSELECSATCDGGTRRKTRTIVVHPHLGAECPPLELEEPCNEQLCPVDCIVDDWSGWSSCSAECGGGVRQRSRTILRPMENDGEPCPGTEEAEECEGQACDKDCALADWTPWGPCNKACGTGHRARFKGIKEPALGVGFCPPAYMPSRLQFEECNHISCGAILRPGEPVLVCDAKSDVVILLDSSGSLGDYGWEQSKKMAGILVQALNANRRANVSVALLEFSSSGTKWITHLNQGTTKQDVDGLQWIGGGTWTADALRRAEDEFRYGRDDASSVVIVITDGQPYSQRQTEEAAQNLQTKARVVWVPVGHGAPVDLIMKMASLPVEDHVVKIDEFQYMATADSLNKIISDTCPEVE